MAIFKFNNQLYNLTLSKGTMTTGNCGVAQLTSWCLYKASDKDSGKHSYETKPTGHFAKGELQAVVDSEEFFDCFEANYNGASQSNPSLFVMSCRAIYGVKQDAEYEAGDMYADTREIMAAIKNSKKGICVMSPFVENTAHGKTSHADGMIVGMWWVPERYLKYVPVPFAYRRLPVNLGKLLFHRWNKDTLKQSWEYVQKVFNIKKDVDLGRLAEAPLATGDKKDSGSNAAGPTAGWGTMPKLQGWQPFGGLSEPVQVGYAAAMAVPPRVM